MITNGIDIPTEYIDDNAYIVFVHSKAKQKISAWLQEHNYLPKIFHIEPLTRTIKNGMPKNKDFEIFCIASSLQDACDICRNRSRVLVEQYKRAKHVDKNKR